MEKNIASLEEMAAWAERVVRGLPRKQTHATVLALTGDLGAGKTAFVQAAAKILGVSRRVASPTFVLLKFYDIPSGGFWRKLVHLDAYRLNTGADLQKLGWDKLLADPQNIIFLEWPERVADVLPPNTHQLFFRFVDEKTRFVSCP